MASPIFFKSKLYAFRTTATKANAGLMKSMLIAFHSPNFFI
jgi:hypothetical protein